MVPFSNGFQPGTLCGHASASVTPNGGPLPERGQKRIKTAPNGPGPPPGDPRPGPSGFVADWARMVPGWGPLGSRCAPFVARLAPFWAVLGPVRCARRQNQTTAVPWARRPEPLFRRPFAPRATPSRWFPPHPFGPRLPSWTQPQLLRRQGHLPFHQRCRPRVPCPPHRR